MKPILEIQQIGKRFNIGHRQGPYLSLRDKLSDMVQLKGKTQTETFWALQDVSFDVQPGESIGIVGRNGAGKSTLLKILSKITPPSTGRIISRGRMASLLEVGTGFHLELTGRENIFLNGSILGMKKAEIQKHFDAIVDFSGTGRFLDTPLKHYSSGMQLRLAFAVAAFLSPEILVIDEVLAVGDAEFQAKCMDKMSEVTSQGRTVLFVSHNMAAVEHLCTRGVFLEQGKVRLVDSIEKVIAHYLHVEKSSDTSRQGLALADGVMLKDFKLSADAVTSLTDLDFSFTISSAQPNRISDLVLLVYNHLNERVGIVDLRREALWSMSSERNQISIEGTFHKLPLIEGVYNLGLYISAARCQGDFLNLKRIEVLPPKSDFVPYALKHRGAVEFDRSFKIRE